MSQSVLDVLARFVKDVIARDDADDEHLPVVVDLLCVVSMMTCCTHFRSTFDLIV
jgi:hypothetical protein